MTVTAPFANPTATCDRSSVAENADIFQLPRQPQAAFTILRRVPGSLTGNGFFPLLTATVLKHVGIPVFLTGLSSAQTFNTGWLLVSALLGSSCIPPPRQNQHHTTLQSSPYPSRLYNIPPQ
jgi:hypothetical protein